MTRISFRFAAAVRLLTLVLIAVAPASTKAAPPRKQPSRPQSELSQTSAGQVWHFKKDVMPILVRNVPKIVAAQDPKNGHWGEGIWIVNDQHPMFTLAVAWGLQDPDNPYYHDAKVLDAITKAGDALIADADSHGQWVFRKKDGSTWGKIFQPWTYSRWVRAYAITRDSMSPEVRERWDKALILGYTGVADEELSHTGNIPVHHAMGLYFASQIFNKPVWAEKAVQRLRKAAAEQHPDGYWTEHVGPVIGYNFVYVDALGAYYAASHDPVIGPVLERAARFHAAFTYPDGSPVETVDERQVYSPSIAMPGFGFSFSEFGRGYMHRQWQLLSKRAEPIGAEGAAMLIKYGEEGSMEVLPGLNSDHQYITQDGNGMIDCKNGWFACLSGYVAEQSTSRWIQDRQNLVSLFNLKAGGLIFGGGNTKLTPLWSTFTVGDVNLLRNTAKDSDPSFIAPPGLYHVPSAAKTDESATALALRYDSGDFGVRFDLRDPAAARVVYTQISPTTAPAAAHVPLFARMGQEWSTASGKKGEISSASQAWKLAPGEAGAWFQHWGWRVSVPPQASIQWPVPQHNQYAKYGEVPAGEGAIVMTLPFDRGTTEQAITITPVDRSPRPKSRSAAGH